MGWEGAWRHAEVVLAKQEHLPAYSMRIVKARIGLKCKSGSAFTLDSGFVLRQQTRGDVCLPGE